MDATRTDGGGLRVQLRQQRPVNAFQFVDDLAAQGIAADFVARECGLVQQHARHAGFCQVQGGCCAARPGPDNANVGLFHGAKVAGNGGRKSVALFVFPSLRGTRPSLRGMKQSLHGQTRQKAIPNPDAPERKRCRPIARNGLLCRAEAAPRNDGTFFLDIFLVHSGLRGVFWNTCKGVPLRATR